MNEERTEYTTEPVKFVLTFGPDIKVPVSEVVGDDIITGAIAPLYATVAIGPDLAATDDLDRLVEAVGVEVRAVLHALAEYMTSENYIDTLEKHLLTSIATYRGTVLRKGIPNRETRRSNGERSVDLDRLYKETN